MERAGWERVDSADDARRLADHIYGRERAPDDLVLEAEQLREALNRDS
jgi:hypothetical protein